jgi:hypothetical protein
MASPHSVKLASEIDVSNIAFGDPKSMGNGGKILYMNYDGEDLKLQTPEVRLPFDVSEFKDQEGGNDKYNFTCALEKYDSNKDMKEFYEKLVEIDTLVKGHAKENSTAFFKKSKISDETIEELYNPIVKLSKDKETGEPDGKYPPNIKVKVSKKNGAFMCRMYDIKKNIFDIDKKTETPADINELLVKGTRCKMLLKCTGVWVINGKFGCTWSVVQALLNVAQKELDEFAFRETNEDVQFIESDDDDDDDDDESDSDSEEEAPVNKTLVKKVRKAKTNN